MSEIALTGLRNPSLVPDVASQLLYGRLHWNSVIRSVRNIHKRRKDLFDF